MSNLTGHTYKQLRDMTLADLETLVADSRRERIRLFWSTQAHMTCVDNPTAPGGREVVELDGYSSVFEAWKTQCQKGRTLQAALQRRVFLLPGSQSEDLDMFYSEFDKRFDLNLNDKRRVYGPNLAGIFPR